MPFLGTLAPLSDLPRHPSVGGTKGTECLGVWGLESHGTGSWASLCLLCGLANYVLKLPYPQQ